SLSTTASSFFFASFSRFLRADPCFGSLEDTSIAVCLNGEMSPLNRPISLASRSTVRSCINTILSIRDAPGKAVLIASCIAAVLTDRSLLQDLKISLRDIEDLTHRHLPVLGRKLLSEDALFVRISTMCNAMHFGDLPLDR